METTKNYFSYKESQNGRFSTVRVGFLKSDINTQIPAIVDALVNDMLNNCHIHVTENFIIFQVITDLGFVSVSKKRSKHNFQVLAHRIKDSVIFCSLPHHKYYATKKAQNVIKQKNIQEKLFSDNNFVCFHEQKLVNEIPMIIDQDISLQMDDLSVSENEMDTRRKEQIAERILSLIF